MTRKEAEAMLPRVGERRMEVPAIFDGVETPVPRKCVVVEVSIKGLWYRVRFVDGGRCECYKVPKLKRGNGK